MATLQVLSGNHAGKCYELSGDQVVIGRYPFCDIVLPSHSISRQHARIVREGPGFFIEDLNSLNGTFVNGHRISGRHKLKDDDRIHLYEVQVSFHEGSAMPAPSPPVEPAAVEVEERDQDAREATIVNTLSASSEPNVEIGSQVKLRAVLEITRNLGQSLDVNEFLPNILDSLFEIFPQAGRGYILLAEGGDGKLSPRAVKDRRGETGSSMTLGPISRSVAARVMSDGEAILTTDLVDGESGEESILDVATSSQMSAPLMGPSRKPLGIIHIDTNDAKRRFKEEDLEVLVSVATVAGQALEHARVHEFRMKLDRRQRELATAREVQLHFLPQRRPEIAGYKFYDYYLAADDVGGDYFGYIPLPDGRLAIAIGDVSGKGVSAALLMARLCSEVRFSLATAQSPHEAVGRLNQELSDPALSDRFVTFLLCVLDPRQHQMTVVTAGHMPPMHRQAASGKVKQLGSDEGGPPLGFDPEWKYGSASTTIEPNDVVVMYTDGISEATNPQGDTLGISRVAKIIAAGPADAEPLGQSLLEHTERFSEGYAQSDDVCMVVFSRRAP